MVWQIGVGLLSGYMLTRFTSGKKEGEQGRFKSTILKWKKHRIHIHHWMHQSALAITFTVLYVKETWSWPPWLYQSVIGMNIGAIIQGLGYKDWKRIIYREED